MRVRELLEHCQIIVAVLDDTEGLLWEFGEIFARGLSERLVVVVPDAGHAVIIEKPWEVNTALLGFLQKNALAEDRKILADAFDVELTTRRAAGSFGYCAHTNPLSVSLSGKRPTMISSSFSRIGRKPIWAMTSISSTR